MTKRRSSRRIMLPMIVIVWEFQVQREKIARFEQTYSSKGPWAALFRRSSDYIDTSLLCDSVFPARYLVIDRWETREAYDHFKRDFAAEYNRLDQECEELTRTEKLLGIFDAL